MEFTSFTHFFPKGEIQCLFCVKTYLYILLYFQITNYFPYCKNILFLFIPILLLEIMVKCSSSTTLKKKGVGEIPCYQIHEGNKMNISV